MLPSPVTGRPDQRTLALDERLAGAVERVTFHSDETGFCVLQVRARGYRRVVTLVGHVPSVAAGEFVEAEGGWVHHRAHGAQFQADTLAVTAPATVDDLRQFLASGLIRGVGPALAQRLVAAFGARVLDVIERQPDEIARVRGIGTSRAQIIAEAWAAHRSMRDIAAFLGECGIAGSLLVRVYRAYGADAIDVISTNPYRLALDLPGFGFAAADRVASRLDIDPAASIRLRAGIASVIAAAVEDGDCGLPRDEAGARASRLLDVPAPDLAPVIDALCAEGEFVAEESGGRPCLFPRHLHRAELAVASRLRDLARGAPPWGDLRPDDAIARAEAALGIAYSAGQREALRCACGTKVLVVTGGPGVGKTMLVRGLLHMVGERGAAVALCAPTGRAARRLAAVTGRDARTIHRLLGATRAGIRGAAAAPLACDLLVVDEASMVDMRLMAALLGALPDRAALLVVGDRDQLPSIGPGEVLADIIRSGAVPVARLDEVFRQEAESRIITAAHAINRGEVPDLEPRTDSDLYFIDAAGPAEVAAKIVTLVRDRIPNRFGLDPVRDIQVLCPVNRDAIGAQRLNLDLQAALNPPGPSGLVRAGWTYGPGDKVMQVRNDYDRDVSNGEIGIVRAVDQREGELTVGFDERRVTYGADALDELALAYAITIHKAQGSEYPAVVIPVVPQHAPVLRRSLLYTGVTRASRLVVMVGSRAALARAVGDDGTRRRWSRLEAWLRAGARDPAKRRPV